jgi:hypothetical protein
MIDRALIIELSRRSIERLPQESAALAKRLAWSERWLAGRPEAAATSTLRGSADAPAMAGEIRGAP